MTSLWKTLRTAADLTSVIYSAYGGGIGLILIRALTNAEIDAMCG
jgi:hypothetical protein